MQKQVVQIPGACIYNEGKDSNYPRGYFGNFPIYDIKKAYEYVTQCGTYRRFQDICFGPYVDYDALKGVKIRSVDDFFTVYKPGESKVTIYDQNVFDNKSGKIDWFDRDSIKQEPIIFEPKFTLYATPRRVDEPQYKAPEQTLLETAFYNIISKMGFDELTTHYTGKRFFAPSKRPNFDSGFLFKTGKASFSWYRINSTEMAFDVLYLNNYESQGVYSIQNSTRLIKCLQEDRAKRNEYFKQQYSK